MDAKQEKRKVLIIYCNYDDANLFYEVKLKSLWALISFSLNIFTSANKMTGDALWAIPNCIPNTIAYHCFLLQGIHSFITRIVKSCGEHPL